MAANVVFERDPLEIIKEFLALRKVTGPLVSGAERERVGVVRRIDAAAGVSIDVPGAAEFVVFLDDGVGNAEPAERDTQRNGADTRADDQYMLLGQGIARRAFGPACFARDKAH